MKNFGLISCVVLLLCLQTTINSQQICPTFYTGANLQGNSFQMCSSGDVPSQWNDQALSVYVPPGHSVQLYQDSGFGGESLGSYTQGSYSVSSIGLSSVIVSSTQTQTQTQTSSQTCPTFYRNENQQGDSFQMCSSGDVPSEWNDQALSFYVPSGYSVQLYQDSGFSGQNLGSYTQGSYNVPTNGQLSSVTVSSPQAQVQTQGQASSLKCPTFYRNENQQGDSFQMCSSGDVSSQWNDQPLSFSVPSGYSVQLYQDSGFKGQSNGLYTQGSYNLPTDQQLTAVIVNQTHTSNLKCPTFYRNESQQGDSFQMCSSGDVPPEWKDQSLSFYVPSGYSVKLYRGSVFGEQNLGSFTQGSYNVPIHGQLSSVTVSSTQTQTQTQTQTSSLTCPTFYRDLNQQGDSFQLCSSGEVPDGWNDQASSLYIPNGYTVLLYQDSGFGGVNFASYSQGSYNMPAGYDNQLSSVIISQSQSAVATTATATNTTANATVPANTNTTVTVTVALPLNATIVATLVLPVNAPVAQAKPADRKCPTFYRDIDQQGDSFMLCSSGNVPSSWDNQVSSFYVPPGYYVKLYPNRKYGGGNFGTYSQGLYDVPGNFNDQLSSVLMIKR